MNADRGRDLVEVGARHAGIVAHSIEGGSLCLRAFALEGARRLGPQEHPDVSLDCIAVARSKEAWDEGDYATVRDILATSVRRLERAGAEFFVCADNTAHLALESDGPPLDLPGLHIAEVVAEHAARLGYRHVGVMGTKHTMEGPIYRRELAARGMRVQVPDEADRLLIDEIIDTELVYGVFTDESRREFVRIVDEFKAQGCDAVALVCTEIPLLLSPEASPLPTPDSTVLLAHAALGVATGDQPLPLWRGGPALT